MKIFSAMFFLALLLVGSIIPANASMGYFIYQLKNSTYDPTNAPFRTLVGGPYDDLTSCNSIASKYAQSDQYHHIFTCSYEYY